MKKSLKRLAFIAAATSSFTYLRGYSDFSYTNRPNLKIWVQGQIKNSHFYTKVHADSSSYAPPKADNISYNPSKIKPDPKALSIPNMENLELINVQVFYRHGARTPLKRLPGVLGETEWNPKDLMKDNQQYEAVPCKWVNFLGKEMPTSEEDEINKKIVFNGGATAGLLTNLGHQQIHDLGQRLKTLYIDQKKFVDPHYNHHQVYARSTNINRMYRSSQGLISSMFEVPIKAHGDESGEVTIAVEDLDREFMFPNPRICPPLLDVIHAYLKAIDNVPNYKADLETLKQLTGIPKDTKLTVTEMYDTLKAIDAHDLPKPLSIALDWDYWMEKFERYVHQSYTMLVTLDKNTFHHSLRWSIGPVLETILANMRTTIKCNGYESETPPFQTHHYKMYLYAVHDSTLNPLLLILGNLMSWVPYASDLIFELYQDDKKHPWVRVLFNGEPITIPGATQSICSLEHFINVTAKMASPFESFCSEKLGERPDIKITQGSFIGI